jgi:glycerophosphoryl diester phosphodiesterase
LTALEVVAHRGAAAGAPEHTLGAYRQAAAVGADAVECDVRLTRDGVLVCVHDRQIRRTSNGRGVVSALHLAELEQYQFGPRKPRGFNRWADDEILSVTDEPDVENGLVLTLDRLLDYITATPGTLRLAIETKHPTRHTRKVEEALVECLRRYGLLGNGRPVEWAGKPAVRMMSFSQLAVRRMAELAPAVPTVLLIGKRLRPVRREVLNGSATAASGCCAPIRSSSPTPTRPARRSTSGR